MDGNHEGPVAVVTGAARGIGEGIARRLAARGARLVVSDVDESAGREVARELGVPFVRCDVREAADHARLVEVAAAEFGGLDLAVLNAGIVTPGSPVGAELDPARWGPVLRTNVEGVLHGLAAVVPALRARGGGSVVVTASAAGLVPVPFDPVYGASKAAVVGLVRSLAPVYAADGVRINALCPTFTATRAIAGFHDFLHESGLAVLGVPEVVDAFEAVAASEGTGGCWYVEPGHPPAPFGVGAVPEARLSAGAATGSG